jgi:hypothetical protein
MQAGSVKESRFASFCPLTFVRAKILFTTLTQKGGGHDGRPARVFWRGSE